MSIDQLNLSVIDSALVRDLKPYRKGGDPKDWVVVHCTKGECCTIAGRNTVQTVNAVQ